MFNLNKNLLDEMRDLVLGYEPAFDGPKVLTAGCNGTCAGKCKSGCRQTCKNHCQATCKGTCKGTKKGKR